MLCSVFVKRFVSDRVAAGGIMDYIHLCLMWHHGLREGRESNV